MKKLTLALFVIFTGHSFAQTTLFSDDFESGSTEWTLNGGSGTNQWIVNQNYLASTASFGLIPDTPNEPGGIVNSPNSNYLHIYNTTIAGALSVSNANYDQSAASEQNATMNTSISTSGMNTTTVSFWYLSNGNAGTAQGKLQYSTDGGTSWTDAATYFGVSTWTQVSVNMPAFDNQPNLLFRFNWNNAANSGGTDPALAIDDIKITALSAGETITAVGVSDTSWCFNALDTIDIGFTSAGTFNVGNVYTAELSDATGSFTSAVAIGSLNSNASGTQNITCVIPMGTAIGGAYRVRVNSSNPSVISADNGSNLKVNANPTVFAGNDTSVCQNAVITLSGSGAATYTWDNGITDNSPFTPAPGTTTFTVLGTDNNGCKGSDQVVVTVSSCAGITAYTKESGVIIYPNPVNDYFELSGNLNIKSIKIVDESGRTVRAFSASMNNKYSVNGLESGVYFVHYTDGTNNFSIKILKN
jgi:hypothetical protein